MTSEEKRLERYRKYNASKKGQDRDKKYEAAHPERKDRWSPIMTLRANKNYNKLEDEAELCQHRLACPK